MPCRLATGSSTRKVVPRPDRALDGHGPLVRLHDALHQREAEAGAALRAA